MAAVLLLTPVASIAATSPPAFTGAGTEYYFYSDGDPQLLTLNTERIAVRFAKGVLGPQTVAAAYPDLMLVEESGVGEKFRLDVFELYDPSVTSVMARIAELNGRPDVEMACPIFDAGGREAILTDELWVHFQDYLSDEEVGQVFSELGAEVVKRSHRYPHWYVIKVTGSSPGDALSVSNVLAKDARVKNAHPDFVVSFQNTYTPNDTRYPAMWNLNHIGQRPGDVDADIDAPEGWDLSRGSSSVTVAVLDGHGVQIGHPDFSGKIDPGSYDYYSGDSDPSPPNGCEAHGTNCAGIAAAATHNSLGISAVGFNVRLMGARIGSDPDCDGSFSSTTTIIADAIEGCADNGAEVESNSWSQGGTSYAAIHNAIIYATTKPGHGGLLLEWQRRLYSCRLSLTVQRVYLGGCVQLVRRTEAAGQRYLQQQRVLVGK
jgi:hypothetical protein